MDGVLSADVTEVCARYSITSDLTTCQAGTERQDADSETQIRVMKQSGCETPMVTELSGRNK